MLIALALLSLLFALVPAVLYARNVRIFKTPRPDGQPLPPVSILIPARNESASIDGALEAALLTRGIEFEVVVLDDHSEDDTARRVRAWCEQTPRVRLEQAPPLPEDWCGKQHACATLAKHARHDLFCFVDADVRLAPDGVACLAAFMQQSNADLVSGFPLQETGTFLERLLLPLIQFLLLGFLPLSRMRKSKQPGLGAGCGQLFLIRRQAYEATGGHEMVRTSLHDGLTLPRAFRAKGFTTDLCDATYLATCRMYRSGREVWFGLAKNAREGLASTRLIVPATIMLLLGQVLPLLLFVEFLSRFAILIYFGGSDFFRIINYFEQSRLGLGLAISGLATIVMYYPRFDAASRFRQPMESALLHPFGMLVLLAIQWYALGRSMMGGKSVWRGRAYPQ